MNRRRRRNLPPYAVIFDLRGTLANTKKARRESVTFLWKFIKKQGVDITKKEVEKELTRALKRVRRRFHMRTTTHDWDAVLIPSLLRALHIRLKPTVMDRLLRWYEDTYVAHLALFEDARAVLRELKKKNVPMGIVIDGTARRERKVLRRLKLAHYFSAIIIGEEVGKNKFSLLPLRAALAELGVPVQRVFVVGDRIDKDVLPANKLGCISVKLDRRGNTRTGASTRIPGGKPKHRIATLRGVLKLLPKDDS